MLYSVLSTTAFDCWLPCIVYSSKIGCSTQLSEKETVIFKVAYSQVSASLIDDSSKRLLIWSILQLLVGKSPLKVVRTQRNFLLEHEHVKPPVPLSVNDLCLCQTFSLSVMTHGADHRLISSDILDFDGIYDDAPFVCQFAKSGKNVSCRYLKVSISRTKTSSVSHKDTCCEQNVGGSRYLPLKATGVT